MNQSLFFAVDVALIPGDELAMEAISINKRLLDRRDSEIRLAMTPNVRFGLPHISLGMFFVGGAFVLEARDRLNSLLKQSASIQIEVERVSKRRNSHGSYTYSLDVLRTAEIQDLHQATMSVFSDWLGANGDTASFLAGVDSARESDAQWISQFAEKAAFSNFDPHITLGFGDDHFETGLVDMPQGRARAVGIYRLGSGCTCREILQETAMTKR
jgi:hypothetical protein